MPLWAGRTAALLGVILVSFNLRVAVAALSPISHEIGADIPLNAVALGVLGTLPPICFAAAGFGTPFLRRWIRLETLVLWSMVLTCAGHLVRGLAGDYSMLVVGSVLLFAASGVANIALPPLFKAYFPDRIGTITAIFVAFMGASSVFPPLLAVPIADASGWRVSLGLWAGLAFIAIWPWLPLVLRRKSVREAAAVAAARAVPETSAVRVNVWRSPLAWCLAALFAMASILAYAMFAWLPEILMDRTGMSPGLAGAMLAVFSIMGIPASIVAPLIAARLRNLWPLLIFSFCGYVLGLSGLLFLPHVAPVLWIVILGFGTLAFPLSLLLINLRTRTQSGAVTLSGF